MMLTENELPLFERSAAATVVNCYSKSNVTLVVLGVVFL